MIPEIFHSDGSGQHFGQCSACRSELVGNYFIEKVFRRYENGEKYTVFEMAICKDCHNEMMDGISDESRQRMTQFMEEGMKYMPNEDESFEQSLSRCNFTGQATDELKEFHVLGFFRGDHLLNNPVVMSAEMREEQAELLSEQTKDFFDDFMKRIIDLPPDIASILGPKRTVPA